jgi:peptide-methionine (S)-S-oxide reductase
MASRTIRLSVALAGALVAATGFAVFRGPAHSAPLPSPAFDLTAGTPGALQTAVFAGGCFWGVEAVFEHVKGVTDVVSGYAGGSKQDADYEAVSSGTTGHAESVRITYDPAQVSYGTLLQVFFSVAHDPTQLNRQGPDVGPQYRSAIFYETEEQAGAARAYIEQLASAKTFNRKIVTQVNELEAFYPAEEYHQNYAERNPNQPYIVVHDRPKVEHLRKQFPNLFRDKTTA